MIDRVEVVAGQGTVMRYGAIVAWASPSASPALISFLAQSARNLAGSARGGRQMSDHISGVLRERDPEPHVAFAVVGPDSDEWAALLHGPVQIWDGRRWLSPDPNPGWLQSAVLPQPSLTVNAIGSPAPAVFPDTMWDLEAGVVPGSGFVLFPRGYQQAPVQDVGSFAGTGTAADPEPEPMAELAPAPTPTPEDTTVLPVAEPTTMIETVPPESAAPDPVAADIEPPAAEPEPPLFADPEPIAAEAEPFAAEPEPEVPAAVETAAAQPELDLEPAPAPSGIAPATAAAPPGSIDLRSAPGAERWDPLPVGSPGDRLDPGKPVVAGVRCERGHLNRPGMIWCARCGAHMVEDSPTVAPGLSGVAPSAATGRRPGLGCLVGDDGTVWRLDDGYLVGSSPSADPTVRGGVARPLALAGGEVSPVHAEVRLKDWDVEVVDRSSQSGTFVYEPGASEWTRLPVYEPKVLRPGTHISFGQRILTFVTPWVPAEGGGGV